jgi:AAA15 family ATPase/GTPase
LEREIHNRIFEQKIQRVPRDLTGDGFLIIQNENWDYVTPFTTFRRIENTKLPSLRIIETCKSYNYDESVFADLWSNLDEREKSININNSLKIMDSRILRAFYTTKREAKVRLDGYKEAQKMTSLGEGVTRIFQLFILAYSAEGGILTIDEFENGLHYSVQEDVFRELFRVTKELGVQVFITTHSAETIKAFSKVANEDNKIDARLIGLERSEKKSTKDKIFSITYEAHEIQSFIELGMEVRG